MGSKTIGQLCCVMHIKESGALIEKRRASSLSSLFNWMHIAPQHPVNHYILQKHSSTIPYRKILNVEVP